MDNRPIGVFDSGVGGLTVVKKIREFLPNESLIYIGDTARVPYGTRSKETIARFSQEVASKLLGKSVKALVVACNTISSTCLDDIFSLSSVPVVDVIGPTVRQVVSQTKSNVIAVIGTNATIRSGAYEKQTQEINPKISVISLATPLFVPIIEEGLFNHRVANLMISDYLSPLKRKGVDVLILGCTHYPLIKSGIERFLGNGVKVVDSAEPTARALKKLLSSNNIAASGKGSTQIYFTSDDPNKSMDIAKSFLGQDIRLEKIEI